MIIKRISAEDAEQFANAVFAQQEKNAFSDGSLTLDKGQISFAIWKDEQLVGVISGKRTWENIHVTALAVSPAYQGQGLGTVLLTIMEEWAKENQITSVTLSTKSYQAKGFYVKQGYQLFGQLEHVPVRNVTKYHFVKYL